MNKKKIVFCVVPILAGLALAMTGCKGSDEGPSQATGRLLQVEGCKSFSQSGAAGPSAASDRDCLEYAYDGATLRLRHVNAGFNCCPGEIHADIRVDGWTVIINEREQAAGCHCLCLFDLEIEIVDLPPGSYQIQVIEPYVNAGEEPLAVTLQLNAGASGRFCAERDRYPWGNGMNP